MKTDKALLRLNNETLLERTIQVCHRTYPDAKIFICGRTDHPLASPDRMAYQGPLVGFYDFISRNRTYFFEHQDSIVLVLPVDLPHLSGQVLTTLAERLIGSEKNMSFFQGVYLPCAFLITPTLMKALKQAAFMRPHLRSFKTMSTLVSHAELDPQIGDEPILAGLQNVNTPEQWNEVTHEFKTF